MAGCRRRRAEGHRLAADHGLADWGGRHAGPLQRGRPVDGHRAGRVGHRHVGGARPDGHREGAVGLDGGARRDGDRQGGGGLTRAEGHRAVDHRRVVAACRNCRPVGGVHRTGDGVGVGAGGDREQCGLGVAVVWVTAVVPCRRIVGRVAGAEEVGTAVVVLDDQPLGGERLQAEVAVDGHLPVDGDRNGGHGLARGEGHHLAGHRDVVTGRGGGRSRRACARSPTSGPGSPPTG